MERPDHDLLDDEARRSTRARTRPSRRSWRRECPGGGSSPAAPRAWPRSRRDGSRARGAEAQAPLPFTPVVASTEDKLILPPGYTHSVLLRWGDPIFPDAAEFDPQAQTAAKQERQFGSDNDFIGFMPLPRGSASSTRGLLGVNHENVRPELTWPTWDGKAERTREMCDVEVAAHGFTVVEIVRSDRGEWSVVKTSPLNRRITGATPMAIQGPAAGHPLMRTGADPGGTRVLGTLNNCAGGVTPWGTILTGEENIQNYFRGKVDATAAPALAKLLQRYGIAGRGRYMSWGLHDARFDLGKEPNEPNRFGWIVEIDPYDPASVPIKHTGLGRFAHEGATVILSKDGRPVAYMGDDARFEYLYKFVATGRYDPANPARRDVAPGQRRPLRGQAERRRHGRVAAAGPRAGPPDGGQRVRLAGRGRHQRPRRGRPARGDEDGPSRGRGAEPADREGLLRPHQQRRPQARPGGQGQPAPREQVRPHPGAHRGRRRPREHALSLGDPRSSAATRRTRATAPTTRGAPT